MDIFGQPLFAPDFFHTLFKLSINMISLLIIIFRFYKPTKKGSEFIFTFMVFSPLIFFICHFFGQTELSLGFAFGLFAVFSILRYRTTTIPVKEMTYMFVIIGLAVINAIGSQAVSVAELLFVNFFLIGIIALMEKGFDAGVTSQVVHYEKIENLSIEKEAELLADLSERTGKTILRYDIVESDFLRDSVTIKVYYKPNN
jgi:hypothetical protein